MRAGPNRHSLSKYPEENTMGRACRIEDRMTIRRNAFRMARKGEGALTREIQEEGNPEELEGEIISDLIKTVA